MEGRRRAHEGQEGKVKLIPDKVETAEQQIAKPRGRPFPPGNNANPRGRPKKGTSLTERLRAKLQQPAGGNRKGHVADVIVEAAITLAKMGDMRAIEFITERVDGKVVDRLDIANADDKPFKFTLTIDAGDG